MHRISVPQDVAFTEIGGEAVLVNCRSGVYFGLDPVGTRMWEAITRTGDLDLALPELLDCFDVDAAQLRDDVRRFHDELVKHGLLETSDEAGAAPR